MSDAIDGLESTPIPEVIQREVERILVRRGLIPADAIDPPEPELPKGVYRAKHHGDDCYLVVSDGYYFSSIDANDGTAYDGQGHAEYTDIRPVDPKPPAPSDLMERAATMIEDMTHWRDSVPELAAELRKHTDPVAVTADELERIVELISELESRANVDMDLAVRVPQILGELRAKAAELRRDEG